MSERVVHVDYADYDVYIGRSVLSRGLKASKWQNPFRIHPKRKHDPEERQRVVEEYRQYLLKSPALLARLPELEGKVLGCWCKFPGAADVPCHGDVLVELLEASRNG